MNQFTHDDVVSLVTLSGFQVLRTWKLQNGYWGNLPESNEHSPWWLVKTESGLIQVGWRKRVLEIDWSDTGIRFVVTEDDVTKSDSMVHAWSIAKAVEYLTALKGRSTAS
jgi:hypothetical protein